MARGLWKGAISFGLVNVRNVVLDDEDFRRANFEASKTVDVHALVDLNDIPPLFFARADALLRK